MKHIASNSYYNNVQPIPVSGYDSASKSYFATTEAKSGRIKMDELLESYLAGDENYNIANEPLYISPNDCTGITLPQIPDLENVTSSLHSNQVLKMKISDVNTNVTGDNNLSFKMH
jgi:hypothetical protein